LFPAVSERLSMSPAAKVNSDIGRRAYELYEERASEQGHDVDDDWLQAERELGDALNSTGA
jgi:DUF2934 family protein